jgi:hypothetical protein
VLAGGAVAAGQDAWEVVRGAGYEGAIIPAASLYNKLFRDIVTSLKPDATLVGWTPTASDIAVAERELRTLVERASKDATVIASLPEADQPPVRLGLPLVSGTLATLIRQYAGFKSGAARHVVIHGIPDGARRPWRTEPVVMLGGGCENFWFVFNLDEQRVTRFRCGSGEAPSAIH